MGAGPLPGANKTGKLNWNAKSKIEIIEYCHQYRLKYANELFQLSKHVA